MSMELDNTFTVPVTPEVAWDVLLDVARIAPCMPGATVDEVDGDVVTGRIKIKVGPVSLTYRGTAKFNERDEAARTVLVEASGKETRGAGTAAATIKASLAPAEGEATLVNMHTTMNVTGRPAQFGRGVMIEVGGKLVDQFAQNLARQLASDSTAAPADTGSATEVNGAAVTSPAGGANGASSGDGTPGAGTPGDGTPGAAGSTVTAGSGATSGTAGGSGAAADAGTVGEAGAAADAGSAGSPAVAAPPPAAPASEDSINLIRLVGPAILKRAIPVAAAAAAVALLGRRIRRALRRGAKD
jgi:carbon monoxide dehydrogenase subunit G